MFQKTRTELAKWMICVYVYVVDVRVWIKGFSHIHRLFEFGAVVSGNFDTKDVSAVR